MIYKICKIYVYILPQFKKKVSKKVLCRDSTMQVFILLTKRPKCSMKENNYYKNGIALPTLLFRIGWFKMARKINQFTNNCHASILLTVRRIYKRKVNTEDFNALIHFWILGRICNSQMDTTVTLEGMTVLSANSMGLL